MGQLKIRFSEQIDTPAPSAVCPLSVVPLTILTTTDLASQFKFDFQEAEKAGVKLTGRKPKQTKKL